MEQLVLNPVHACPSTSGRLMEVQMLLRKVQLKLSKQEMDSLTWLIQAFLSRYPLIGITEKSIYYRVFHLFEHKVRPRQLSIKTKNLNLDIPAADALRVMAQWMRHAEIGIYERNLLRTIIEEIHQQTI